MGILEENPIHNVLCIRKVGRFVLRQSSRNKVYVGVDTSCTLNLNWRTGKFISIFSSFYRPDLLVDKLISSYLSKYQSLDLSGYEQAIV